MFSRILASFTLAVPLLLCAPQFAKAAEQTLPVPGMVTMIDLGAKSCVPCKMMAPILEKLEAEYKGKAAIVFIDVWEKKDEAKKYGIRSIPTQIFYDKAGKERSRHEGFIDEAGIKKIVDALMKE